MRRSDRSLLLFAGAAICGVIHAAFTLHWAMGGGNLVETLGDDINGFFSARRWLMGAVGVVKGVAACAPLVFRDVEWPCPRLTKGACWIGGGVLIIWGGSNTVIGNLVLVGAFDSSLSVNRAAMLGHAWLWDPLFLLWGSCLVAGLIVGSSRSITEIRSRKPQR